MFDILIIGGGIVGAALARDASLRGYSVLLLEAVDFGHGTSSRSSKMLHGGVRYLEQGDLPLVYEALREREILLEAAPHLNRVQETLFPVIGGLTRPAWQINVGLQLYDFLANPFGVRRSAFGKAKRIPDSSEVASNLRRMGLEFDDLFSYSDGQMNDLRIVIENIVDARTLGAVTVNHAKVEGIRRLRGGRLPEPRRVDPAPMWEISWVDGIAHERRSSRARFLVNASGPWIDQTGSLLAKSDQPPSVPVLHSRGTHLIFDIELPLPSMILPTGISGRYYFVHPFFSPFRRGTLVGPTHGAPSGYDDDPQPNEEELAELFAYLERDLPGSGLGIDKLYRAFCGVRTLVPNEASLGSNGNVSDVSRRDKIVSSDGYLAVLGGKYTTARMTAETVVSRIDSYFGKQSPRANDERSTRARALPGGKGWNTQAEDAAISALTEAIAGRSDHWIPENMPHLADVSADVAGRIAASAVRRFGMASSSFVADGGRCIFLSADHACLEAEALYSIHHEQTATLDDLILRRLELGAVPGSINACRQSLFHWYAEYCSQALPVPA
ncbi:MAG: glycerol-3-phosphate dehydrogenase/oxidase [Bdellovibrionota bacterium]